MQHGAWVDDELEREVVALTHGAQADPRSLADLGPEPLEDDVVTRPRGWTEERSEVARLVRPAAPTDRFASVRNLAAVALRLAGAAMELTGRSAARLATRVEP